MTDELFLSDGNKRIFSTLKNVSTMANKNGDVTPTASVQTDKLPNKQLTIAYWSGEEPTEGVEYPCPALNEMPAGVDIAMLAFGGINDDHVSLNFDFLTKHNTQETIKGWIKQIQANGTKVLLSILGKNFADVTDPETFANNVQQAINDWGTDGIDIDYEPPYESDNVIAVVKQLRNTLGVGMLITAPIYSAWSGMPDYLKSFAEPMDFLTTMDYTSYPGLELTEEWYNQYASVIGGSEKLAVGVSCMNPLNDDFTPVNDVITLCKWKSNNATKRGVMLYTFSYDMQIRSLTKGTSGTGYANFTFINTIINNLTQQ